MPAANPRACWVAKINKATTKSVAAIIELGQTLIDAKKALDSHGEWLPMINSDLPFGRSVAEHLMRIARDKRLSNSSNWTILPPVLSTLLELTKLSDDEFKKRKAGGTLHHGMTCKDAAALGKSPQNKILPPADDPKKETAVSVNQLLLEIADNITALTKIGRQRTAANLKLARKAAQKLTKWAERPL